MFSKKKKTVSVPIEEYEFYRDKLLEWDWLTEAFDTDRNKSVYKTTEKGVAVYSAVVHLVGKESLVNGYKLDVKVMEGLLVAEKMVKQETIDGLLQGNIITQTYDPKADTNSYELTPVGAKIFVAFFVSYDRQVGTLPGDSKAKFFEIMNNMPRYVNTASALISQLGNAFQSFDSQGGGVAPQAPQQQTSNKPKYSKKQKQTYAKNKAKWKKEKAQKKRAKAKARPKAKTRAKSKRQYKEPKNEYSDLGDRMMKDMTF